MIASRRRFLFGAGASLLAAPAIVRVAANLMPIKPLQETLKNFEITNDLGEWRFEVVCGSLRVGDTVRISGLLASYPSTYKIAATVTA